MLRVYFMSEEGAITDNCGKWPIIITAVYSYDTPIMKESHKSKNFLKIRMYVQTIHSQISV